MRRGPVVLLAILAVTAAAGAGQDVRPQAPLPSVDELFDKYVEAIGGQPALDKITTRVIKASIVTSKNTTFTVEEYWKAPDSWALTLQAPTPANSAAMGIVGNASWIQDGGSASRAMSPAELANAKLGWYTRDRRLKTAYKALTVRGRETVDGADVYVVDTVPMFGGPERLYFDASSGLLVRMDRQGLSGRLVNYLEDYRAIDGVKLAFRTRNDFTNQGLMRVITITEVKHNVPIDDAVFRAPRKD
jgi:hypothetical protein